MRLIAVVMGAPSDEARADDSQQLLRYGFRFFETHTLYKAGQKLAAPRVWSASTPTIPVGVNKDIIVTIPTGTYGRLKANMNLTRVLKAPIQKGQALGFMELSLNGKIIQKEPLIALEADPKGGLWIRFKDSIKLTWNGWFHNNA